MKTHQILKNVSVVLAFVFLHSNVLALEEAKIVENVLSLMSNVGTVVEKTERPSNAGMKNIEIKTKTEFINIEILTSGERLNSVTRVMSGTSNKSLVWKPEKATQVATSYLKHLFEYNDLSEPLLVTKENIDGTRNLWSVGWVRQVNGYKVHDDFVNITLNEEEGLFGFAYSWDSPIPTSIPTQLLTKEKALEIAKDHATGIMKNNPSDYSNHLLGKSVSQELMIVTPMHLDNEKVKSNIETQNSVSKKARLAWVIPFKLEVNPNTQAAMIATVSGITAWIDAETGVCLGEEY